MFLDIFLSNLICVRVIEPKVHYYLRTQNLLRVHVNCSKEKRSLKILNLNNNYLSGDTGVRSGDIFVSFKAIFQDVRQAIDHVHNDGDLKRLTVENLDYYVVKDERLGTLFDRMHENNGKVFLLTNSGYEYTDQIMGFLLNDEKKNRHWKSYFDYILVDARKPLFFAEGTSLKEIDIVNIDLNRLK